jgi:AcrR family transcriptional regulator
VIKPNRQVRKVPCTLCERLFEPDPGKDKIHRDQTKRRIDARVRRTRDALGDALVALMQQKPFDAITVQDVLDLAGVGRSTFYVHYSDKSDLLMSHADEFFEAISTSLSVKGDKSQRLAPVKEFFTHVRDMHQFLAALVASGRFYETFELARGHFARGIERRLAELPRTQSIYPEQRRLFAVAHAGALLSLLTWWLDHGVRETPEQMDELFHRMAWSGMET